MSSPPHRPGPRPTASSASPTADYRWLLKIAPLMVALMLVLIAGGYFVQKESFRQQERRMQAFGQALSHGKRIEQMLTQAMTSPGLLASALHTTRSLDQFDAVAARIIRFNDGVSRLQLAPDGHLWRSFSNTRFGPAVAGEAIPSPAARADAVIFPIGTPVVSATSAELLISQTIHAQAGGENSRFWGHAQAVVRLPDLVSLARLDELDQFGFVHELVFRRRGETAAISLHRSPGWRGDSPVVQVLPLISGDSIELAVVPRGGWAAEPFLYAELALVLIAALLVAVALYVLLRKPIELAGMVEQRTGEIESANARLESSARLLDSIFASLPLMLILKDADTLRIERVNEFAEAVLGRESDALVGMTIDFAVGAEVATRLSEAGLRAALERQTVHLGELSLAAPEGTRVLDFRVIPLFDEQRVVRYLLEVGEEITERRTLTLGIERQLHFLEQLIDAIPMALYFTDTEGRFINVNLAFERLFGFRREDLVGRAIPESLAGLLGNADGIASAAAGGRGREAGIQAADGRHHYLSIHCADFLALSGQAGGNVGIIADVSERVATARHIEQLNRTFAVLSGVNEAVVRIRDRGPLLDRACEILVERGAFPVACAYRASSGEPATIEALKGSPAQMAIDTLACFCACPGGRGLPGCGESSEIVICTAATCPNPDLFGPASKYGMVSLVIVPLRAGGPCIGGLAIFSGETDVFSADEIKLLSDMGDDLSYALEAMEAERARRAAESKLQLAAQVFENSSEGIMITDAESRILAVNKTFTDVTGYAADEVIGRNPKILSSGKQEPGFYREMWRSIRTRGEWHGEVQNRRKNGAFYSEWLTISAVRNDQGALTNYVAVFSDITSSKQIEERLNFLANYDTLTSLPNRVLFTDRLEQALTRARVSGRHAAVLFLDLDRFSLINETFGHSAGDGVLLEIARRLKANLRAGDSVSRLGGDEFAAVIVELESGDEVATTAAKIMQAIGQPLHFEQQEFFISASIGISVFPDDGEDGETLIRNADSAMYRAMEEGRNTFRFYHQEMNARSSERMSLESELRYALERGELVMHYQPFVDSRTGRIVGAEALLRWYRPEIGYITPAAFIPLLEDTGLIVPVGEWVLRTACEDNRIWRQHGFQDLFVAVNFSALQLVDAGVSRKVGDLLSGIGFDPQHLEIELTESAVMRDAEVGIRTLHEFKELGTMLSVDDFGTGYSSLSYLKKLPIDTLKIDRSFVIDTPDEQEARAIVQAIIAMGHSLRLKIIAEGVQEPGQVAFLREAHCDLLQGFHFSPAVSQADFISLLREPEKPWAADGWSSDWPGDRGM